MGVKGLSLIMIGLLISPITNLDITHLMNLGTVPTAIRSLVYYTYTKPSYLTVDLIPNLKNLDQNCNYSSLNYYNKTALSLIQPIADNINRLTKPITSSEIQSRFFGAVIGTIALGVATAAQVTAAIGLAKAQENAKLILTLKKAATETNEAVRDLANSNKIVVKMISAIQNQINTIIQPAIDQINCQIKDLQVANILNLYLTEITTVFHNQLTNPALESISIQALKSLLGPTLPEVLSKLDLNNISAASVMASGLIKGQIIAVDIPTMTLVLMVQIPSISPLRQAKIIDLTSITIHTNSQEVQAVVPARFLEIGSEILGFDGSVCQITKDTIFCPYNDAYELPIQQKRCLQGQTRDCVFTPVAGTFPRRFLTTYGTIVANCRDLVCSCLRPPQIIYQPDENPVTIIDKDLCTTLTLDSITIEIQKSINSTFRREVVLESTQVRSLTPLDLSTDLNQYNQLLKSAEDHIQRSTDYLNSINPSIVNNNAIIILIILCILLILTVTICIIWLKYLTKEVKNVARNQRLNRDADLFYKIPSQIPVPR
ncbi:fusion protein [Human parainfluenza virus 4a]|uniref:Fusion glycoprotein F0 n=1 Tax=Human parainfluenza virus 4a TaxID=11224 RepID=D7US59_9MONO|nr:fusion protein [Human parainfluenza virus 4a]BAJ11745.1 fusion protein [Human parainfluenza virus 4a]